LFDDIFLSYQYSGVARIFQMGRGEYMPNAEAAWKLD